MKLNLSRQWLSVVRIASASFLDKGLFNGLGRVLVI